MKMVLRSYNIDDGTWDGFIILDNTLTMPISHLSIVRDTETIGNGTIGVIRHTLNGKRSLRGEGNMIMDDWEFSTIYNSLDIDRRNHNESS